MVKTFKFSVVDGVDKRKVIDLNVDLETPHNILKHAEAEANESMGCYEEDDKRPKFVGSNAVKKDYLPESSIEMSKEANGIPLGPDFSSLPKKLNN